MIDYFKPTSTKPDPCCLQCDDNHDDDDDDDIAANDYDDDEDEDHNMFAVVQLFKNCSSQDVVLHLFVSAGCVRPSPADRSHVSYSKRIVRPQQKWFYVRKYLVFS